MSRIKRVEFDELVGRHSLSAVWTDSVTGEDWAGREESSNCIYFRLDGEVYRAKEDPDDGYRSTLDYIEVCPDVTPQNAFAEHEVVCFKSDTILPTKYFGTDADDCLVFVDVCTGRVVMCIGTSMFDNYYPNYEAAFYPEALKANQ